MKDQMVRVAKEFAADESGVGVVEIAIIYYNEFVAGY